MICDGLVGSKVIVASEIGASVMIGCMDPNIEVLLSLGTFVETIVGDEVIGLRMVVGAKVVIGASVIGAFVVETIVGDGVIGLRVGDKVVIGASVTGDIVFFLQRT